MYNFHLVEDELPVFLVLKRIWGSDRGANEDYRLVVCVTPRGFVEIDPCFTEISVHFYHITRCHESDIINL